ncbi:hypothetical protein GRAN_3095 [Granulicella sibirica]|uniref:Uncharacterized protein n=1 Tax=Granulicella sibirica TaxID=2479048 RepID=A0A4Q0T2K0_9BACT|nr:hypothetical protein GRAN_3095 [Granulicella sibirica]
MGLDKILGTSDGQRQRQVPTQIPFGNDNQKGKSNGNGGGL